MMGFGWDNHLAVQWGHLTALSSAPTSGAQMAAQTAHRSETLSGNQRAEPMGTQMDYQTEGSMGGC